MSRRHPSFSAQTGTERNLPATLSWFIHLRTGRSSSAARTMRLILLEGGGRSLAGADLRDEVARARDVTASARDRSA
jgi:hypothetical protein